MSERRIEVRAKGAPDNHWALSGHTIATAEAIGLEWRFVSEARQAEIERDQALADERQRQKEKEQAECQHIHHRSLPGYDTTCPACFKVFPPVPQAPRFTIDEAWAILTASAWLHVGIDCGETWKALVSEATSIVQHVDDDDGEPERPHEQ